MAEINLISKYPQRKRNLDERLAEITEERREIARKYGKEYFHGGYCYNNYQYKEGIWEPVVKDIIRHYNLKEDSSILDIGCAMGYALFDFKKVMPGINVAGIDISEYAIENAKPEIKKYLAVGDAKDLSKFKDKEFDLVLSISTIHNLSKEECVQSLKEIQRVGKKAFITVDAWRTEEQRQALMKWLITAKTYMHIDDWKILFKEADYNGDYYWFNPVGI